MQRSAMAWLMALCVPLFVVAQVSGQTLSWAALDSPLQSNHLNLLQVEAVAVTATSHNSAASETDRGTDALRLEAGPSKREQGPGAACFCVFFAFCGALFSGTWASASRKIPVPNALVAGAVAGCGLGYFAEKTWMMAAAPSAVHVQPIASAPWVQLLTLNRHAQFPVTRSSQLPSRVQPKEENDANNYTAVEFNFLKIKEFNSSYFGMLEEFLLSNKIPLPHGLAVRQTKRRAANNKPLIWLHLHKEAGTFTCLSAVTNGERPVAPSTNCNWQGRDTIYNGDNCSSHGCPGKFQVLKDVAQGGIGTRLFPQVVTCEERQQLFRDGDFTFGGIERELHETDICPGFRYGTALREPMEVMESRLLFDNEIVKSSAEQLGIDTNVSESAAVMYPWLGQYISQVFEASWNASAIYGLPAWKFIDNFKIRTILGDEAYNLGPGKIGQEHLEKAIQRLEQFQLVKIIGGGRNAGKGLPQWDGRSPKIGWEHQVNLRANANYRPPLPVFYNATKLKIAAINKFDAQLFEHFAEKARVRLMANEGPTASGVTHA